MSGFLAGLVQRGAGLPARPAEPVAMAAPSSWAPGAASYSLEAPPQTVDVDSLAPIDASRPDPALAPSAPIHPAEPAPERVRQVLQVTAVAAPPVGEAARTPAAHLIEPLARAPVVSPPASIVREPAPAHEPTLPGKPGITNLRPQDVPFPEAPVSAAARQERVALDASRAVAPEPRFDALLHDAARPRPVVAKAAPIATPVRELPEVRLEAATTAQSLAASPATREVRAAEPPPIHVRIGKVEVRAPAPPAAPDPARKPAAPVAIGFAAYRRLRTYR